ncbi:MAG: hypothetical protein VYD96_00060, partial [Pseudomonadota bacterium]|nr:hypothetical protein [Pseudomonadota bacterium]
GLRTCRRRYGHECLRDDPDDPAGGRDRFGPTQHAGHVDGGHGRWRHDGHRRMDGRVRRRHLLHVVGHDVRHDVAERGTPVAAVRSHDA